MIFTQKFQTTIGLTNKNRGLIFRSTAQCNKGFDVLYCVGVEHFIQVAVQIRRGPSMADRNLENIHTILHCQMCEEWAKIPNSRAPTGTVP